MVGAGVVALGANSAMPDKEPSLDPSALSTVDSPNASGQGGDRRDLSDHRASRNSDRSVNPPGQAARPTDVWLLPVNNYKLTSRFGSRWGRLHGGVDLAGPVGTPVHATRDGVVVKAEWYGGYGKVVIIKHDNGIYSLYGHNSAWKVKEGQRVKAGQLIALMGNTGHSFGSHSHFEIRVATEGKEFGKQIDPIPFMRERGVDIPAHTQPDISVTVSVS